MAAVGRPTGQGPVRPDAAVLEALITAAALPGLGGVRLGAALASPDGAVDTLERLAVSVRRRVNDVERDRARGWARRALETIHRDGVHVLVPGDGVYPAALARLEQPPCPLFARGRLELLDTTMVAVVGTRKATSYGREAARRIAGGLAAAGITIISGLARGIDGEAHRAAGAHRTIGVLGCGIDVYFPREHRRLQDAIGREGLLLTEQLPGAAPAGHNFPRRNRIIAGLPRAVVVVEAPIRSGALNTARKALEDGRDVFAVPGSIDRPQSAGANDMIRQGGALVTSAREILAALELPIPADDGEGGDTEPSELEGQGLALWRVLGGEPRHADEIAAAVGLAPHHSLASLLALEVRGYARQLPGMRFVRC